MDNTDFILVLLSGVLMSLTLYLASAQRPDQMYAFPITPREQMLRYEGLMRGQAQAAAANEARGQRIADYRHGRGEAEQDFKRAVQTATEVRDGGKNKGMSPEIQRMYW